MKSRYEVLAGYKRCNICKKIRHVSEYNKCKRTKSGIRGDCKICQKKSQHKRYLKIKDSVREYDVKRRFGLEPEEYYALIKLQKNCCALCDKSRLNQQRALHVDHDHVTGRVRGLLCTTCNARLGWYENRKDLIRKYLAEAK